MPSAWDSHRNAHRHSAALARLRGGAFGSAPGSGWRSNGVRLLTSSGTLYLPGAVNTYNAASWNNQITGNTSDNTEAGLQGVMVSLQDTTTNLYWDGTSFEAASETYLPATLGTGGTWSLAVPNTALTDGHTYTAHALATDGSGNVQATPGTATFLYDNTAPATPPAPTLDPGSDSGVVGDNLTNVATPTLTGVAEPNSSVQITDNGVFLGQAVADINGNWSFTVGGNGSDTSALALGAHSITVTATDAAGNVSALQVGAGHRRPRGHRHQPVARLGGRRHGSDHHGDRSRQRQRGRVWRPGKLRSRHRFRQRHAHPTRGR